MTAPKLVDYQGWFVIFLEAGFMAVNQADEDAARKLFEIAQLIEPENTFPSIGFGYLHLHKLELSQACKIFEKIHKTDPHHEMSQAFLGICTALQPSLVEKGEKILDATLKTRNPHIKQLTYTAIDFVERFVKKAPGPASVQSKK